MGINENQPNSTETYMRSLLAREYERGLTPNGCAGFHGTSVETIEFAMKNGHIPGSTALAALTESVQPGDLFYFPPATVDNVDQLAAELTIYARNIAAVHFVLGKLQLDKDSPVYYNAAADLTQPHPFHPELYRNARKILGVSPTEAVALEKQASNRKGVVLGISEDVFQQYSSLPGDPGENDARIRTVNGLPVRFIRGIMPLGGEDSRILRSILKVDL